MVPGLLAPSLLERYLLAQGPFVREALELAARRPEQEQLTVSSLPVQRNVFA